jgi:Fur family ferric uptake transcriptional regulator
LGGAAQVTVSDLKQIINGKYKMTRQREIVFNAMNSKPHLHFSVEDIWDIVHEVHPEIGVATIYRTLQIFIQTGIVQRLELLNRRACYEISEQKHHHMICLSCGAIAEVTDEATNGVMNMVKIKKQVLNNFREVDCQIYFYGYCENCQAISGLCNK